MTHKPNILALNFTHQNKDEKNFVDTVVLLGVRNRTEGLASCFCPQGPAPCVGPSSWSWGWGLRLQGPWGGVGGETAPNGKEELRGSRFCYDPHTLLTA